MSSRFGKTALERALATLRASPGSHITGFLILHELTAIVPLVVIFSTLQGFRIPILPSSLSQESLNTAERSINRFRKKLGWEEWQPGEASDTVARLGLSYAAVKLLIPVRIAASLALTPWFARRVIQPCYQKFRWRASKNT